MISKNEIKLITSLQQKKYRLQHRLFVAEGQKIIQDFMQSGWIPKFLFASEEAFLTQTEGRLISEKELQKISSLKNQSGILAVFEIPEAEKNTSNDLTVVLDAVRDPGNLGTIIRMCDWFGVKRLICSEDTVDCYNPKVIQATMGSIARVEVTYQDIEVFLKEASLPVYAAVMEGENVYNQTLPRAAVLVMGNEGNGISEKILQQVTHHITIPQFGKGEHAESLNVSTATAILLSEFRRTTEK